MTQQGIALVFGVGLLVYLMASVWLVPFVATEKNRSFFGWAFLALLFSPLLALIALAAVPVKEAARPPVTRGAAYEGR